MRENLTYGSMRGVNGCEVGSEVEVNIKDYGRATVRDVIKMNGVGIRLGVSWRF